ncbi:hypothetical protein O181_128141 [Austropuccinia psidii MF-1]|uniref:Reverse transcriptase Ty1/copia-type domain-containing protein n=1 Tax=Austropuccinia psidii MF-1 TaxID=1389203 RepID=A0A9Q3Q7E7_9BASI|nr:hypothetical protein [Austropuccinia psidii MF-1]
MDVKTAFLHGDLDETIYMYIPIPNGYSPALQGKVCLRLKHSFYGLQQSARSWYLQIKKFFSDAVFLPSAADPCFFIGVEGDPCFVFLHINDLVIGRRNLAAFKAKINASLNMKDLGNINCVLGMKITRDLSCRIINLSQELYIENMLIDFGMGDCRPVSTPQDLLLLGLMDKTGHSLYSILPL